MPKDSSRFRKGRRSASARCPRCRKVRKLWVRANAYFQGYTIKSKNVRGEGKICWVCRIRELQPDWRPGMLRPRQKHNWEGGDLEFEEKKR